MLSDIVKRTMSTSLVACNHTINIHDYEIDLRE